MAAGADGLEHALVGDRGGVALALELELGLVDAARHVGGEHQQQVDRLGGARRRRRQEQREQQQQPIGLLEALRISTRLDDASLADFERPGVSRRR